MRNSMLISMTTALALTLSPWLQAQAAEADSNTGAKPAKLQKKKTHASKAKATPVSSPAKRGSDGDCCQK